MVDVVKMLYGSYAHPYLFQGRWTLNICKMYEKMQEKLSSCFGMGEVLICSGTHRCITVFSKDFILVFIAPSDVQMYSFLSFQRALDTKTPFMVWI